MRLLRAAHPGPAVAVTVLAGLLGLAVGLGPADLALVVAAVATGQLTIGWTNDLLDAPRDRAVGRADKPLATGELDAGTVRLCVAAALVATVVLSLATGVVPGPVQLLTVASGWAYNLGLKSTAWSWAPYAVAFGALPAFVSLVEDAGRWPAWWLVAAGALLGVGAHLVNVLPDLADDAATGVRGLPHRLGARRSSVLAASVLTAATVVVVLGATVDPVLAAAALVVVGVLAVVALVTRGRTPFRAAIAMALVDVAMLVVAR
jgi:4-hydroxybenzoate polyprenyltransferase